MMEGVGLEKIFLEGLKAGGSLFSSSSVFFTLFLSAGGSGMKAGKRPIDLCFLPGLAGLNGASCRGGKA